MIYVCPVSLDHGTIDKSFSISRLRRRSDSSGISNLPMIGHLLGRDQAFGINQS